MSILQTDKISRKDRCELITKIFFLRRAGDSGKKEVDEKLVAAKVESYEKHLSRKGIQPENYSEVYELACQIHASNGAKGPFGIDEVLMGADEFKSLQNQLKPYVPKQRVSKNNCPTCKGTGLHYLEGKIQYKVLDGKKIAQKCTECYVSEN